MCKQLTVFESTEFGKVRTREKLNEVLKLHKKWLDGEDGGVRANLRGADLTGADLKWADLTKANLTKANLRGANLTGADLKWADLTGADLTKANLKWANLRGADLTGADLKWADLKWANLTKANLREADLKGADLDFSCLPLWCGSLKTNFDDRVATQILYHLLSIAINSTNVSQELKDILLTTRLIEQANKFHRAEECGKIER
jgi:hypothetical protein